MRILHYNTKLLGAKEITPSVGDVFYLTNPGAKKFARLIVEISEQFTQGRVELKTASVVRFINYTGEISNITLWHDCFTVEHKFD
jgi:hypothetical protein